MSSIDDNHNPNPNQEIEESIIPVLTVFKNNSILKNIFIVLNNENDDHTLLVGRHPNCNIVLTHPSISRFHLQIRFTPSSRSISLLDLSSVHGTWVSGRKLEHGVSVDLKEGDSFQLGVSSRVYLLHFVSKFDADPLKKIGSLGCDDERKNHFKDEIFEVDSDSFGNEKKCCDGENKMCGCQICFLSPPYMQSVDESDNTQINEDCTDVEMPGETNLLCTLRECFKHNMCVLGSKLKGQSSAEKQWINPEESFDEKDDAPVDVIPKEAEFDVTLEDTDNIEDTIATGASDFDSEDMLDSETHQTNTDEEVSVGSLSDAEEQVICSEEYESELQNLNANSCHEKGYSLNEIVENIEKICIDNTDPVSFDENGVAAVNVAAPREHKLEFFFEENDRIDDILTSVARLFISENISSLVEEAIPAINFQQMKIVEEVAVDSTSDGEKENKGDTELQACVKVKPCDEEGSSLDETEEATPAINFQQMKIVEEVAVDSISDGEKENKGDMELQACVNVKHCDEEGSSSDETEEATPAINFQQMKIVEEVAVDSISVGEKENKGDTELQACVNVKPCDEEGSSPYETVEDAMKSFQTESLNPSVSQELDLEITDKKENQTPQSVISVDRNADVEILERSCIEESAKRTSINCSDILSRRDKDVSVDRIRKSRLLNTPSVDTKFVMINLKDINITNKSMPKDLFSVLDEEEMFTPNKKNSVLDEEEMLTPNKENSSPTNTFHLQFMRKNGVLEESKSSKSERSNILKASCSPIIYSAERSTSAVSNKENHTPREAQGWKSQRSHNLKANFSPIINSAERSTSAISNKENLTPREALKSMSGRKLLAFHDTTELRKKIVERIPLQSLMSSGGNCNSRISSPLSAAKSMIFSPLSVTKSIVGVTARASNCGHISDKHTEPSVSQVCEERKKSWDMVVDTASLLNKESRKALQLLQGLNGTRLIIPQSVIRELGSMKQQFGIFRRTSEAALALEWIEECMGKTKWWIHILDCAFPMVEDHILDCALEYRRKDNVGQIVLLSDDVNLKIKSMAKGLLCETVQQFHLSLVNPFSERFMWANSSPRGLTWSCKDDVVLREKYCCLPSKAGLKILVT